MKGRKKDSRIELRVSKKEKEKLEKLSKKNEMTLSEYLLYKGLSEKQKTVNFKVLKFEETIEEICNYISLEYGNDRYLEKMRDKLWVVLM